MFSVNNIQSTNYFFNNSDMNYLLFACINVMSPRGHLELYYDSMFCLLIALTNLLLC